MHVRSLPKTFLCMLLMVLFGSGFIDNQPEGQKNERVAVVFLKHSSPICLIQSDCLPDFPQPVQDAILTPRHTATQYENILNFRISAFYDEVTYNKVHLTFDAIVNPDSADGWFDAPHSLYEYNQKTANIFVDALDQAYPIVGSDLQNYDILLVVQNFQVLYGFTQVYGGVQPGDFVSFPISTGSLQLNLALVAVGENPDDTGFSTVVAHEFGHVHSLYHSFMWRYDQMGGSDVLTHFNGWSKVFAGWLTGITNMPCIQGPCEISTSLTTLEREGNNLLRIPFTENPFVGYIVECRSKIGFDSNIPDAGVLVTSIDTASGYENAAKLAFPGGGIKQNANPFTADAALAPGESFVDEVNDITITYVSKTGTNDCNIKATRGEITAPDLLMKGALAAAENSGGLGHSSYDIWMDSQENGWDTYAFNNAYTNEGGQVAPTKFGDPFWVNHENRIRFKVRNDGYGPADNARVNIYVRQPLTVYIPGITCRGPKIMSDVLVGSVVIDHLEAGEIYFGYVPWTPKLNSTALVTVVIEDYAGEITHANNIAKETYPSQFQAVTDIGGSMSAVVYQSISGFSQDLITLEAVANCLMGIPFYLYPIKPNAISRRDWVMEISKLEGIAQPNITEEIQLSSIPPRDAKPGECGETGVVISALMDDINIPVEAFSFRSCMVNISTITCRTLSKSVNEGSKINITGSLSPSVSKGNIALEFTSPSGKKYIENAPIIRGSGFSFPLLAKEIGDWNVQTFWQGDDRTSSAESEICSYRVISDKPQIILDQNTNCRSGPGKEYEVTTSWLKGDILNVIAQSPDSFWLYTERKGTRCWVASYLGETNFDIDSLPIRQPPFVLSTPSPTDPCSIYVNEAVCLRHSTACKWIPPASPLAETGVCVSK